MATLAALITLAGIFTIPHPTVTIKSSTTRATIDWIGAFLITAALLCLTFALTEGNVVRWSTPWIPVLIVVSVFLILLFLLWQHRLETQAIRAPLMKISIFRNREFSASILTMVVLFASFNGYLVYATYFYQEYQSSSPLQTTLRFIPTGVTGVTMAIAVSYFLLRIPAYFILLLGSICVSTHSLLFAIPIPPDTTYFAYGLWAMMLATLGADTTIPSLSLFVSHALAQEDQAMGGALLNAAMQFGKVFGLAIATTTQTIVMARARGVPVENVGQVHPRESSSLAGLRAANWLNFAFGLCAFCVVAVSFRGSGIVGKAKGAS